jgi:hypothetical protein
MSKMLLFMAAMVAGAGSVQAQVPDNKTEAPNPAPRTLQNSPPDKMAPNPSNPPNVSAPDEKAEAAEPALKMDTGRADKPPGVPGRR